MTQLKYYKYKGDVSEHKDNIFVQNNKDWFIFVDQEQKLVTARLIKDHLEKMTGWKNFISIDITQKQKELIDEGIARIILKVGYAH